MEEEKEQPLLSAGGLCREQFQVTVMQEEEPVVQFLHAYSAFT